MSLKINLLQKSPSLLLNETQLQTNSLRADALILYICLGTDTEYQRDSLACLLWQDADAEHSRGSLRQLIRRIKKSGPELGEILRIERDRIFVSRDKIQFDLDEYCRSFEAHSDENIQVELQFNTDDLFANYTGFSSSFDAWVSIMRNKIETRLRETLSAVIRVQNYSTERRTLAARSLLNIDPTHEPSCQYLMQMYTESGDTGAAIRIYNELYNLLDQEFDIEPTDETIALIADIKLGKISAKTQLELTASKVDRILTSVPEVFVSEFEFGHETEQARNLTRVFRHELMASLSTFREWRLFDIEPTTPRGYRLEGIADDYGSDIVFIATLKLYPDARIVWSERFQVGFKNWNTVQWQIAQRMAVAINSGVGNDRLNKCITSKFETRTVFDKWVLAQSLIHDWKPEKVDKGLRLLEDILDEDPHYGPAHSSLAMVEYLRHINLPGTFRSLESLDRSLGNALAALEIDPLDTRAHLSTAWAYAMKEQYEVSVFHFEHCFELNPNSVPGRLSCALGFAFADQLPKALSIVDETLDLVGNLPPYLWGYVQNIWFLDNRIIDALKAGERAGSSISNLPAWQATALWETGQTKRARSAAIQFAKLAKDNWRSDKPCNRSNMVDWFVGCFPLKNEVQSMRLREGLSAALYA